MPDGIIICGTNWLGDSVMSMPAIQAYRRLHPDVAVTLIVKPGLVPLWQMHPAVDRVVELDHGLGGIRRAAAQANEPGAQVVFVLPNSFRSALVACLTGVSDRVGRAGRLRSWMLTRIVDPASNAMHVHQAWEYMQIFGLDTVSGTLEDPRIRIPEAAVSEAQDCLESRTGSKWVALMPGAARGRSKQWPPSHFAEVGRHLASEGYRVVVLGTRGEEELCSQVALGVGSSAVNLAGRTSLSVLAAVLSLCRTAVTNDSGGMHLAAAVGVRVVSVFGITDPTRTGPLGQGHRLVLDESAPHHRDVRRDSPEAQGVLHGIRPDRVYRAAHEILQD